jgi:hypothetical protein
LFLQLLAFLLFAFDIIAKTFDAELELGNLAIFVKGVLLQAVNLGAVFVALGLEGLNLTLKGTVSRSFRQLSTVPRISYLPL